MPRAAAAVQAARPRTHTELARHVFREHAITRPSALLPPTFWAPPQMAPCVIERERVKPSTSACTLSRGSAALASVLDDAALVRAASTWSGVEGSRAGFDSSLIVPDRPRKLARGIGNWMARCWKSPVMSRRTEPRSPRTERRDSRWAGVSSRSAGSNMKVEAERGPPSSAK